MESGRLCPRLGTSSRAPNSPFWAQFSPRLARKRRKIHENQGKSSLCWLIDCSGGELMPARPCIFKAKSTSSKRISTCDASIPPTRARNGQIQCISGREYLLEVRFKPFSVIKSDVSVPKHRSKNGLGSVLGLHTPHVQCLGLTPQARCSFDELR